MGPHRDRPTGGVVAGAIVIVGSIVGVAKGTASAGAEVEIRPEGADIMFPLRVWNHATERWL